MASTAGTRGTSKHRGAGGGSKAESVRLSAAIITYNEEKQIEDCIASVHDWCDEVLVLDSFSKDATKRLAKRFSRVVFREHSFDGHVQQKNRAIDMCRGEWIFSLDADERATPELAAAVRDFIAREPEARGARVKRLTYHLGDFIRHSGWYGARTRLIRRGQGRWGGENPHDALILAGDPPEKANRSGPVLEGDLIHYSFKDLSDQIDTINKFSSIVAFGNDGKGKRASLVKILVKPWIKFLESYVFKQGFRDGMPGFVIAVSSAFSTFLKWVKLWELQRTPIERFSNLRADYQLQQSDAGAASGRTGGAAKARARPTASARS